MTEPLLAVEDVNGYYGSAHVLQGVSFRWAPSRSR